MSETNLLSRFMAKETNISTAPEFVKRDSIIADKEYVEWLSDVKARFHRSQIKASVRVNISMLEFYWSIGRDLLVMRAEQRWGAGVVKQFALDMRQAFPNETGFSDTNVKYMKRWHSFYYVHFKKSQQDVDQDSQQTAAELNGGKDQRITGTGQMIR